MKYLLCVAAFLFLYIARAQDTLRRFEFGATLITLNPGGSSKYYASDRARYEFLNGIFFRYNISRVAIRASAGYSENAFTYASPPGTADGMSGDIANKDLKIGGGIQYGLSKRHDWIYAWADLGYRNVFSTGHNYGGLFGVSERFNRTTNGFFTNFGLGFKLKTFRNVYLSPEAGFYLTGGATRSTATSMNSGTVSTSDYFQLDLSTFMRLHLTVKF